MSVASPASPGTKDLGPAIRNRLVLLKQNVLCHRFYLWEQRHPGELSIFNVRLSAAQVKAAFAVPTAAPSLAVC